MNSNILITTLLIALMASPSLQALEEGSACVPELLQVFAADTTQLTGETAAPVVTTFNTPQEPASTATSTEIPICKATYTKFGYCVDPVGLNAWKIVMRDRRKNRVEEASKIAQFRIKNKAALQKTVDYFKNEEIKNRIKSLSKLPRLIFLQPKVTKAEFDLEKEEAKNAVKDLTQDQFVAKIVTLIDDNKDETDKSKQALVLRKIFLESTIYLGIVARNNSAKELIDFVKRLLKLVFKPGNYADTLAEIRTSVTTTAPATTTTTTTDTTTTASTSTRRVLQDQTAVTDGQATLEDAITDSAAAQDQQEQTKYLSQKAKCLVALNIIRGNALCLRTSGAAVKYFEPSSNRYFVTKQMCLDTVPACGSVIYFMIKTQRILHHLIIIKKATEAPITTTPVPDTTTTASTTTRLLQDTTTPTTTTSSTVTDTRVDTAIEAKWKACADEGPDVCGANEARVLELCGDITLDDLNPRFEGDVTGLNYAKVTLEGIENGTITPPTTTTTTPTRRVLASGSEDQTQRGVIVSDSGANVGRSSTDFDSADATDAKESNAVVADKDEKSDFAQLIRTQALVVFVIMLISQLR